MKKYVIGILIGAALATSGQALADTVSNVGKKIQAEYTVEVNGEPVSVKAIAINGVTYTPNRALAAATGYDIQFKDKVVSFTQKIVIGDIPAAERLATIESEIKTLNKFIVSSQSLLDRDDVTEVAKEGARQDLIKYNTKLAELEAEKAELEAQQ